MPKINLTKEDFLRSVIVINDDLVEKYATYFGTFPLKDGSDLKEYLLTVNRPYVLESQILYRFKDYKYFSEESGVSSHQIEKVLTENGYIVAEEFSFVHKAYSHFLHESCKEGFEGKKYKKDNQICIVYQDFEGPFGEFPAEFICDHHTVTLLADNFDKIKS